jgi:hypothetical protein
MLSGSRTTPILCRRGGEDNGEHVSVRSHPIQGYRTKPGGRAVMQVSSHSYAQRAGGDCRLGHKGIRDQHRVRSRACVRVSQMSQME